MGRCHDLNAHSNDGETRLIIRYAQRRRAAELQSARVGSNDLPGGWGPCFPLSTLTDHATERTQDRENGTRFPYVHDHSDNHNSRLGARGDGNVWIKVCWLLYSCNHSSSGNGSSKSDTKSAKQIQRCPTIGLVRRAAVASEVVTNTIPHHNCAGTVLIKIVIREVTA